jgi:hypothetical protein
VRNLIILSLIVFVLLEIVTPAVIFDSEMMEPCVAKNDAEILCIEQGGCPQTGYCYFPDGSYILVWSLYDRFCEGCDIWALSDQGTWVMDTYRFFDSSDCYA